MSWERLALRGLAIGIVIGSARAEAPIKFPRTTDTLHILFTYDARGRLPILTSDASDSLAPLFDLSRWAHLAAQSQRSNTLLLDCGNTFFPGVLSRFSFGSVMNEVLGYAGVSAKRISEKDFMLGSDALINLRHKSTAAFLSSNTAADSQGNPFDVSYHARIAGREVTLFSILDAEQGAESSNLSGTIHVLDPETALQSEIASEKMDSSQLRICLLDENVRLRHPGILNVKGIALFAMGSTKNSQVIQEDLASGARIVHIPAFANGYGRLSIHPDGDVDYSIDTTRSEPADSMEVRRMIRLIANWSTLYLKQNGGVVRTMSEPLIKQQAGMLASLLRERMHSEAACLERSLVQDLPLSKEIHVGDLDKLILSSPDVSILRLNGSDLKSLAVRPDLACSGIENGRSGGQPIDDDELYSVGLTETEISRTFPEALDSIPEYSPRLWPEPLFESIRNELASREKPDWEFQALDKRWRLAGLMTVDASRRNVLVWNGDSVNSIPGDVGRPLSTWEMASRTPIRLYNDIQSLDFAPEANYSRINKDIGSNFLSFRLDYSFGPRPIIRPYASGTYETYVLNGDEKSWPVRIRGSFGIQSDLGAWTLKLGAASEKTITADDPNPFVPFAEVFSVDTSRWDRGAEFVVQGRQDLAKVLHHWWPNTLRSADLTADVAWNNFMGVSDGGGRAESRLRMDLSATLLGNLQVTLGVHSIVATLFQGEGTFASIEPTMALSASYRFKVLP